MGRVLSVLLLLASCDRVFGVSPPGLDSELPPMWSMPVAELDFPTDGDDPALTADLLELYYNKADDIWTAERLTDDAPWGSHRVVDLLSSSAEETTPEVSGDGKTLVLASARTGSKGELDLMITTRVERSQSWPTPTFLASLNTAMREASPSLTQDGREVVFTSTRTADKVWTARWNEASGDWDTPVPFAMVNTIVGSASPFMTADGLAVYFNSYVSSTGASDLYVVTRTDRAEAFSSPVPLTELNTEDAEEDAWVSPDGKHIYFIRRSLETGSAVLMHSTR